MTVAKAGPSVANPLRVIIGFSPRSASDDLLRVLEPALANSLRRSLPLMGRMTLGKLPGRVALRTPDGTTVLTAGRGAAVTVTGAPQELLLFSVGRLARVEFDGDAAAVQAVRDAPKGL